MLLRTLLVGLVISFSLFGASYSEAVKIKKIYPMGEKIYKHQCKRINVTHFMSLESLQSAINKGALCTKMSAKHLEAVSIYLWDHKEPAQMEKISIDVTPEDRCRICGMYVYKYPKWATQITYHNGVEKFDGVKDMMKYYFRHKDRIETIAVRDYYTQKVIDAREAYFVIGSDVYGPMGNELIAFGDKKSATNFYLDHHGKKIVKFSEITLEMVEGL